MEKFVIIDGNSLINRAFYALPLLSNSKGEFSNGVYGFTNILIKAILEIKPKYIAVALDYGKKTFRNDLYSGYKAKRKPAPVELIKQFPILKELLNTLNITYIEKEGFEADDIIGTLSKKFKDVYSIIITGDRDSLQLIDNSTEVWLTKKGITEVKSMTTQSYKEEYGLHPTQVVDLKALMGDSSDNIPGVSGVGEKTALELMKTYGSLDNIYKNLDKIKPKLKEKLENDKKMAYLSQTLSQIKTDMDLDYSLNDFEYPFPFSNKAYEFFKNYDFNSILKRNDLFVDSHEDKGFKKYSANKIEINSLDDIEKQIKHIERSKTFAIDITDEKLSFSYDKNCEFFINLQSSLLDAKVDILKAIEMLRSVLEDNEIDKLVYDKKKLKHTLKNFNIELKGVSFDALLAFYLIIAGERECNKENLYSFYDLEKNYSCVNLFYLKNYLIAHLKENNLFDLYTNIEFPLIDVLFDMEETGFKINKDILFDIEDKYKDEIFELEQTIKRLAGIDFNVNSPKQLGEVLFDKLGLVTYNNKKKSTSIDQLNEMYDMHPIIPAIIRYRKIKKITDTYVLPYKDLISKKDSLIHTVFHQTLTNTGRLSSSEPNLQNIPVRDDEGKNLRKMFVSRHDDGFLVSADYSQIELRLLAHFSNDEKLISAFNDGIDIHSVTASEVFNIPIQEVDETMRRTAKAVNFGIIYGISDYGLSQNINCTRKQAKMYIEEYFKKYPKIKEYIQSNVDRAKETGYAVTLFNRRRKINELSSPNYMTRQFGERIAMNMPLQGTASDIIKLAMIKVYNTLNERNFKSKLILQVHDELIVDATREEVVEVAKILKESMENVVKLRVPLTVDVNSGKTWFDC